MTDLNNSKDDNVFDCSSQEDLTYIAALYGNRKTVVAAFLKDKCRNSPIQHSTYLDIYELIELKLGYPIPLKRLKKSII